MKLIENALNSSWFSDRNHVMIFERVFVKLAWQITGKIFKQIPLKMWKTISGYPNRISFRNLWKYYQKENPKRKISQENFWSNPCTNSRRYQLWTAAGFHWNNSAEIASGIDWEITQRTLGQTFWENIWTILAGNFWKVLPFRHFLPFWLFRTHKANSDFKCIRLA